MKPSKLKVPYFQRSQCDSHAQYPKIRFYGFMMWESYFDILSILTVCDISSAWVTAEAGYHRCRRLRTGDATNIVHNRQSNNSDPSARSGDACRNTSGRRWCVGMGLFQELFPPIPAHGVSSCLSLYKGPVWVWGVIDGYSQYSACKNRVHCPYRHIVGTSPELHVHTGE